MLKFLRGAFTIIAEIVIGGAWAAIMIIGWVALWLFLYALVTGPMG